MNNTINAIVLNSINDIPVKWTKSSSLTSLKCLFAKLGSNGLICKYVKNDIPHANTFKLKDNTYGERVSIDLAQDVLSLVDESFSYTLLNEISIIDNGLFHDGKAYQVIINNIDKFSCGSSYKILVIFDNITIKEANKLKHTYNIYNWVHNCNSIEECIIRYSENDLFA